MPSELEFYKTSPAEVEDSSEWEVNDNAEPEANDIERNSLYLKISKNCRLFVFIFVRSIVKKVFKYISFVKFHFSLNF